MGNLFTYRSIVVWNWAWSVNFFFLLMGPFGIFGTGFVKQKGTGHLNKGREGVSDYTDIERDYCALFHLEATNWLDSNVWFSDMWIRLFPVANRSVRVAVYRLASFDEYIPSMSRSVPKKSVYVRFICPHKRGSFAGLLLVHLPLRVFCTLWL